MTHRSWVLLMTASALAVAGPAVIPTASHALDTTAAASAASTSWGPVKRPAPNPQGESRAVDATSRVTVAWPNRKAPQGVVVQRRGPGGAWGNAR